MCKFIFVDILYQVGLSVVLSEYFGIVPTAVVGHSLGEVAAACIFSFFSLRFFFDGLIHFWRAEFGRCSAFDILQKFIAKQSSKIEIWKNASNWLLSC